MALAVPAERAAGEPPEARGLSRDAVRLMVSHVKEDAVTHTRFDELPHLLEPGDVLVVNTSATINASFDAIREMRDGLSHVEVHLSTRWSGSRWLIELRQPSAEGSAPLLDARAGERLRLAGGAFAWLKKPHELPGTRSNGAVRLWAAELTTPIEAMAYAAGTAHRSIRLCAPWLPSYYQTVLPVTRSVEMPSAARPFTIGMVEQLATGHQRCDDRAAHRRLESGST
jgi:S-adenosylmethionine:tRNA ribosyltransferase-isomerase